MTILIVSATESEIKPLLQYLFSDTKLQMKIIKTTYKKISIDILITGIGLVSTTYFLTDTLSKGNYDLVINAGICGSFLRNFKLGEVVQVTEEQFGDLGIEDNNQFSTLFENNLMEENQSPYQKGKILMENNPLKYLDLKNVKGISVNKVHGNEESIKRVVEKFHPDIESMEGAAVFFVCSHKNTPFAEIRAISNYVEPRNKESWNISLAINNLNKLLLEIINRQ
jgi:futalosine hydrolase